MNMPPQNQNETSIWRLGYLSKLTDHLRVSENTILIALAMIVGLISGLGAVIFHWLIEGTHSLFFEFEELFHLHHVPHSTLFTIAHTALAPALGALIAGSIVWLRARHDHSHGTSAVMESVALHGGRLSARPLLTKASAAGLVIGSGGSAGPEDPSVQIGAVIGSSIGNRLRISATRVNTLVIAGVASAIAASFNAPIAGVFFALEVIAGDFSTTLFAPVVLASVVASIVGRAFLGDQPSFAAPPYELVNPLVETPLYALLGLVAAIVGALLIRAVFLSESLFDKLNWPLPLRAGFGGLLVGLVAIDLPGVFGSGYNPADDILHGKGAVGISLLMLLVAKFIATAITIGSVRVGGTFAPAMVLGAMVGALFGQIVTPFFPGMTAPPAAYALVGMGAVLTAVVRCPITTVLLLFEVTGDYHIILAIMASVVMSHLVSQTITRESIYTERLARKGIQLRFGRDVNVMELITVGEAMTTNFTTVPYTMNIGQLRILLDRTHHHGFPVVDLTGRLFGMVTITDLRRAADLNLPSETPVEEIATRIEHLVVAYPEQSLTTALQKFALADVGRLPVVDQSEHNKLIGIVRRSDIIKAYQRGIMKRDELELRRDEMRLSSQGETQLIEVNIMPGGRCDGRMMRDIRLPGEAIVTSVRRDGVTIIPRGDTVLRGGDLLSILVLPDQIELVQNNLLGGDGDAVDEAGPRYYELVIGAGARSEGKMVAELQLPPDVLIVTLRRDGQAQTVHGSTQLQMGDEITITARPDDLQAVLQCLGGKQSPPRKREKKRKRKKMHGSGE